MSTKKPSRTRTETKVAFQNLDIPKGMSEKEAELHAQLLEATRSSIAELEVSKAAQAVTAASLATQKSLSSINEELTNKLSLLQNVKANISLEAAELTRLYGARVILEHLDVLKAEHDEEKAKLEKEKVETRAQWDEVVEATQRDREREQKEYEYSSAQFRKQEADNWAEEVRVQKAAERDRREQLEKGWAIREEALKAQEKELADLRAKVAGHDEEIKKEVAKQVSIVTATLNKDHKHQLELLDASKISQVSLLESKLQAQVEQLAAAKKTIDELSLSLAAAHTKNAEIATKALEASSDRAALNAVQNFAKDQGANGPVKRS